MPSSTTKPIDTATRIAAGDDRAGYDGLEMSFHWATAILVVTLYVLGQAWGFLAKGTASRHTLQSLHVSLGLTLAAVIVLRILWRIGPGRRVMPLTTGVVEIASRLVHYLLYALLLWQVTLGVLLRWANHDPLSLFGWFTIPAPYEFDKPQAHLLGSLHSWTALSIVVLAGLHAAAALFHHFVLRDRVLRRMLPARWASRGA